MIINQHRWIYILVSKEYMNNDSIGIVWFVQLGGGGMDEGMLQQGQNGMNTPNSRYKRIL